MQKLVSHEMVLDKQKIHIMIDIIICLLYKEFKVLILNRISALKTLYNKIVSANIQIL